ncbi:unnamed protein product [Penicillium discolor]
MATMRTFKTIWLAAAILPGCARMLDQTIHSSARQEGCTANCTADFPDLKTWWHATGEINTKTPVADDNVRQSHLYSVHVSQTGHGQFYDSFVYETIPRSGKGKLCYPDDYTTMCPEDDGISIEDDIGATMAWSQFLYGRDVVLNVTRLDGKSITAADVVIRPTNLHLNVTAMGNSALISVPYSPCTHGLRFSVEFADDIWEYRNAGAGPNSYYVQDVNASGDGYVPNYNESMTIGGREPLNALLIFASPFPASEMVPSNRDNSTVVFNPGVYHFTGKKHAILSPSVSWVYMAPGAYVKGAIQYMNSVSSLKATGFGILSGEQYVYQANTADEYSNNKSDATSLKLWRGDGVTAGQSWTLRGITTNAQPFNGMDFYGDLDNFHVDVADYKLVGSFYTQTDGLQMYPNSHVRDVFYHSGDDTIKTYYPNVLAERITVWKTNNAPIIQMGWYSRNIANISVDRVDVIHTRYIGGSEYYPRGLVGSSAYYLNSTLTNTANTSNTIANYTVSNIRAEGFSPALVAVNLLSSIEDFKIVNASIEKFYPATTELDVSKVRGFTDASNGNKQITMGQRSRNSTGLLIQNYSVGNETVNFAAENWNAKSTGRLNIDPAFWGNWSVL